VIVNTSDPPGATVTNCETLKRLNVTGAVLGRRGTTVAGIAETVTVAEAEQFDV
jgi:hypothetical protein